MLQSPEELEQYCLQELGQPVINIAIDPIQLRQQIDNALQYFIKYHYDGAVERYIKYTITAGDVANNYLSIPTNIGEIIEIYDPSLNAEGSGTEEFERLNFNIANSDMVDTIFNNNSLSTGLPDYYLARQSIATLRRFFTPDRQFTYNKIQGILRVHASLKADNYIFLRAYEMIDPDIDVNIFDDEWIKQYATALVKRQWGSNTKKYQGVQLAGGVVMDGQSIWQEANDEVNRLKEEFLDKYTLPPGFFVG